MNSYMDDDMQRSRAGTVSPFGTLTEPAKTWVDFNTMQAFRAMVSEADMDVSSAIRDWIYLKVHGKTFTDFCVHASKVKAAKLFGPGPNEDRIGAEPSPTKTVQGQSNEEWLRRHAEGTTHA
jgi:hypothetical protein